MIVNWYDSNEQKQCRDRIHRVRRGSAELVEVSSAGQ
jgi:hypothetical protein